MKNNINKKHGSDLNKDFKIVIMYFIFNCLEWPVAMNEDSVVYEDNMACITLELIF